MQVICTSCALMCHCARARRELCAWPGRKRYIVEWHREKGKLGLCAESHSCIVYNAIYGHRFYCLRLSGIQGIAQFQAATFRQNRIVKLPSAMTLLRARHLLRLPSHLCVFSCTVYDPICLSWPPSFHYYVLACSLPPIISKWMFLCGGNKCPFLMRLNFEQF